MIPFDVFGKAGKLADAETREQVELGKMLQRERELLIRLRGVEPDSAHGRTMNFFMGYAIGYDAARRIVEIMTGCGRVRREHYEMVGALFSKERVPGIEEPWRLGYRFGLDHFGIR